MRVLRMMVVVAVCACGVAAYGQLGGDEPGTKAQDNAPAPTQRLRGPARISSGVMQGQILTKVAPIYPPDAKQSGIQGTVILHAIIGKDGHIARLEAISGPEELRDAALDAVKQWTYRPYLLNGEPTEVDTTVIVNFHLNGSPN